MRRFFLRLSAWAALFVAGTASAQTLRLSAQATVANTTETGISVGQIATLSGLDTKTAEALAQVVVVEHAEGPVTIKPEQVLCAIMANDAYRTVALQLSLSGAAACAVNGSAEKTGTAALAASSTSSGSSGGSNATAAPARSAAPVTYDPDYSHAMPENFEYLNRAKQGGKDPISGALLPEISAAQLGSNGIASADATSINPSATAGGVDASKGDTAKKDGGSTTLAELLRAQVLEELQATADDVEMRFDMANPVVHEPTPAKQHWEFRNLGRYFIGTVQWEALLMEDQRVVKRVTVQSYIRHKVHVAVSVGTIPAGKVVMPNMVRLEDRMADRNLPQFNSVDEIVGMMALRTVGPGTPLDHRDFKPLDLVVNGETITVYMVVGDMKIKTSAKAMETGKLHDRVTVRNERTGDKYDATVIGRAVAVVGAVDAATEESLRKDR